MSKPNWLENSGYTSDIASKPPRAKKRIDSLYAFIIASALFIGLMIYGFICGVLLNYVPTLHAMQAWVNIVTISILTGIVIKLKGQSVIDSIRNFGPKVRSIYAIEGWSGVGKIAPRWYKKSFDTVWYKGRKAYYWWNRDRQVAAMAMCLIVFCNIGPIIYEQWQFDNDFTRYSRVLSSFGGEQESEIPTWMFNQTHGAIACVSEENGWEHFQNATKNVWIQDFTAANNSYLILNVTSSYSANLTIISGSDLSQRQTFITHFGLNVYPCMFNYETDRYNIEVEDSQKSFFQSIAIQPIYIVESTFKTIDFNNDTQLIEAEIASQDFFAYGDVAILVHPKNLPINYIQIYVDDHLIQSAHIPNNWNDSDSDGEFDAGEVVPVLDNPAYGLGYSYEINLDDMYSYSSQIGGLHTLEISTFIPENIPLSANQTIEYLVLAQPLADWDIDDLTNLDEINQFNTNPCYMTDYGYYSIIPEIGKTEILGNWSNAIFEFKHFGYPSIVSTQFFSGHYQNISIDDVLVIANIGPAEDEYIDIELMNVYAGEHTIEFMYNTSAIDSEEDLIFAINGVPIPRLTTLEDNARLSYELIDSDNDGLLDTEDQSPNCAIQLGDGISEFIIPTSTNTDTQLQISVKRPTESVDYYNISHRNGVYNEWEGEIVEIVPVLKVLGNIRVEEKYTGTRLQLTSNKLGFLNPTEADVWEYKYASWQPIVTEYILSENNALYSKVTSLSDKDDFEEYWDEEITSYDLFGETSSYVGTIKQSKGDTIVNDWYDNIATACSLDSLTWQSPFEYWCDITGCDEESLELGLGVVIFYQDEIWLDGGIDPWEGPTSEDVRTDYASEYTDMIENMTKREYRIYPAQVDEDSFNFEIQVPKYHTSKSDGYIDLRCKLMWEVVSKSICNNITLEKESIYNPDGTLDYEEYYVYEISDISDEEVELTRYKYEEIEPGSYSYLGSEVRTFNPNATSIIFPTFVDSRFEDFLEDTGDTYDYDDGLLGAKYSQTYFATSDFSVLLGKVLPPGTKFGSLGKPYPMTYYDFDNALIQSFISAESYDSQYVLGAPDDAKDHELLGLIVKNPGLANPTSDYYNADIFGSNGLNINDDIYNVNPSQIVKTSDSFHVMQKATNDYLIEDSIGYGIGMIADGFAELPVENDYNEYAGGGTVSISSNYNNQRLNDKSLVLTNGKIYTRFFKNNVGKIQATKGTVTTTIRDWSPLNVQYGSVIQLTQASALKYSIYAKTVNNVRGWYYNDFDSETEDVFLCKASEWQTFVFTFDTITDTLQVSIENLDKSLTELGTFDCYYDADYISGIRYLTSGDNIISIDDLCIPEYCQAGKQNAVLYLSQNVRNFDVTESITMRDLADNPPYIGDFFEYNNTYFWYKFDPKTCESQLYYAEDPYSLEYSFEDYLGQNISSIPNWHLDEGLEEELMVVNGSDISLTDDDIFLTLPGSNGGGQGYPSRIWGEIRSWANSTPIMLAIIEVGIYIKDNALTYVEFDADHYPDHCPFLFRIGDGYGNNYLYINNNENTGILLSSDTTHVLRADINYCDEYVDIWVDGVFIYRSYCSYYGGFRYVTIENEESDAYLKNLTITPFEHEYRQFSWGNYYNEDISSIPRLLFEYGTQSDIIVKNATDFGLETDGNFLQIQKEGLFGNTFFMELEQLDNGISEAVIEFGIYMKEKIGSQDTNTISVQLVDDGEAEFPVSWYYMDITNYSISGYSYNYPIDLAYNRTHHFRLAIPSGDLWVDNRYLGKIYTSAGSALIRHARIDSSGDCAKYLSYFNVNPLPNIPCIATPSFIPQGLYQVYPTGLYNESFTNTNFMYDGMEFSFGRYFSGAFFNTSGNTGNYDDIDEEIGFFDSIGVWHSSFGYSVNDVRVHPSDNFTYQYFDEYSNMWLNCCNVVLFGYADRSENYIPIYTRFVIKDSDFPYGGGVRINETSHTMTIYDTATSMDSYNVRLDEIEQIIIHTGFDSSVIISNITSATHYYLNGILENNNLSTSYLLSPGSYLILKTDKNSFGSDFLYILDSIKLCMPEIMHATSVLTKSILFMDWGANASSSEINGDFFSEKSSRYYEEDILYQVESILDLNNEICSVATIYPLPIYVGISAISIPNAPTKNSKMISTNLGYCTQQIILLSELNSIESIEEEIYSRINSFSSVFAQQVNKILIDYPDSELSSLGKPYFLLNTTDLVMERIDSRWSEIIDYEDNEIGIGDLQWIQDSTVIIENEEFHYYGNIMPLASVLLPNNALIKSTVDRFFAYSKSICQSLACLVTPEELTDLNGLGVFLDSIRNSMDADEPIKGAFGQLSLVQKEFSDLMTSFSDSLISAFKRDRYYIDSLKYYDSFGPKDFKYVINGIDLNNQVSSTFVYDAVLQTYILRDIEEYHHRWAASYISVVSESQYQWLHTIKDTIMENQGLASFMMQIDGLHYNLPGRLQALPPASSLPKLMEKLDELGGTDSLYKNIIQYKVASDFIHTRLKLAGMSLDADLEDLLDYHDMSNMVDKLKITFGKTGTEFHMNAIGEYAHLDAKLQDLLKGTYGIEYRVSLIDNTYKMDPNGNILLRIDVDGKMFANGMDITSQFYSGDKQARKISNLAEELTRRYQMMIFNPDQNKFLKYFGQDFEDLFKTQRGFVDQAGIRNFLDLYLFKSDVDNVIVKLQKQIKALIHHADRITQDQVQELMKLGDSKNWDEYIMLYRGILRESLDELNNYFRTMKLIRSFLHCEFNPQRNSQYKRLAQEIIAAGSDFDLGQKPSNTLKALWFTYHNSISKKATYSMIAHANYAQFKKFLKSGLALDTPNELKYIAGLLGMNVKDVSARNGWEEIASQFDTAFVPDLNDKLITTIKLKIKSGKLVDFYIPDRLKTLLWEKSGASWDNILRFDRAAVEFLNNKKNYLLLFYSLNGVSDDFINRAVVKELVQTMASKSDIELLSFVGSYSRIEQDILKNKAAKKVVSEIFPNEIKKIDKLAGFKSMWDDVISGKTAEKVSKNLNFIGTPAAKDLIDNQGVRRILDRIDCDWYKKYIDESRKVLTEAGQHSAQLIDDTVAVLAKQLTTPIPVLKNVAKKIGKSIMKALPYMDFIVGAFFIGMKGIECLQRLASGKEDKGALWVEFCITAAQEGLEAVIGFVAGKICDAILLAAGANAGWSLGISVAVGILVNLFVRYLFWLWSEGTAQAQADFKEFKASASFKSIRLHGSMRESESPNIQYTYINKDEYSDPQGSGFYVTNKLTQSVYNVYSSRQYEGDHWDISNIAKDASSVITANVGLQKGINQPLEIKLWNTRQEDVYCLQSEDPILDGNPTLTVDQTFDVTLTMVAPDTLEEFWSDCVVTTPMNSDLDGDTLTQSQEVECGTNPRLNDTDCDGIRDDTEILTYHTDPLKPDTDGDGIFDFDEIKAGLDPLNTDSDMDGVSDTLEFYVFGACANSSDIDSDTLADYYEVYYLGTNPASPDSDGDGYWDNVEINMGYDPLNASTPVNCLRFGIDQQELLSDYGHFKGISWQEYSQGQDPLADPLQFIPNVVKGSAYINSSNGADPLSYTLHKNYYVLNASQRVFPLSSENLILYNGFTIEMWVNNANNTGIDSVTLNIGGKKVSFGLSKGLNVAPYDLTNYYITRAADTLSWKRAKVNGVYSNCPITSDWAIWKIKYDSISSRFEFWVEPQASEWTEETQQYGWWDAGDGETLVGTIPFTCAAGDAVQSMVFSNNEPSFQWHETTFALLTNVTSIFCIDSIGINTGLFDEEYKVGDIHYRVNIPKVSWTTDNGLEFEWVPGTQDYDLGVYYSNVSFTESDIESVNWPTIPLFVENSNPDPEDLINPIFAEDFANVNSNDGIAYHGVNNLQTYHPKDWNVIKGTLSQVVSGALKNGIDNTPYGRVLSDGQSGASISVFQNFARTYNMAEGTIQFSIRMNPDYETSTEVPKMGVNIGNLITINATSLPNASTGKSFYRVYWNPFNNPSLNNCTSEVYTTSSEEEDCLFDFVTFIATLEGDGSNRKMSLYVLDQFGMKRFLGSRSLSNQNFTSLEFRIDGEYSDEYYIDNIIITPEIVECNEKDIQFVRFQGGYGKLDIVGDYHIIPCIMTDTTITYLRGENQLTDTITETGLTINRNYYTGDYIELGKINVRPGITLIADTLVGWSEENQSEYIIGYNMEVPRNQYTMVASHGGRCDTIYLPNEEYGGGYPRPALSSECTATYSYYRASGGEQFTEDFTWNNGQETFKPEYPIAPGSTGIFVYNWSGNGGNYAELHEWIDYDLIDSDDDSLYDTVDFRAYNPNFGSSCHLHYTTDLSSIYSTPISIESPYAYDFEQFDYGMVDIPLQHENFIGITEATLLGYSSKVLFLYDNMTSNSSSVVFDEIPTDQERFQTIEFVVGSNNTELRTEYVLNTEDGMIGRYIIEDGMIQFEANATYLGLGSNPIYNISSIENRNLYMLRSSYDFEIGKMHVWFGGQYSDSISVEPYLRIIEFNITTDAEDSDYVSFTDDISYPSEDEMYQIPTNCEISTVLTSTGTTPSNSELLSNNLLRGGVISIDNNTGDADYIYLNQSLSVGFIGFDASSDFGSFSVDFGGMFGFEVCNQTVFIYNGTWANHGDIAIDRNLFSDVSCFFNVTDRIALLEISGVSESINFSASLSSPVISYVNISAISDESVYIDSIFLTSFDLDSDGDGISNIREMMLGTSISSIDSDDDSMPDGWEISRGTNPLLNDTGSDLDGDSLSNLMEYTEGTIPFDNDTDNDGMPDGWEVFFGLNPKWSRNDICDNDMDGVCNIDEFLHLTNPVDSDSDNDGMPDGFELDNSLNPINPDGELDGDSDDLSNLNEMIAGTDPWEADTDSDLMPDGWEVLNELNPLSDDALLDPDNDYLLNYAEFIWRCDPQDFDTDDDEMGDGCEIFGFSSNPLVTDTDNDGINNWHETMTIFTNYTNADTDGDGINDLEEITIGSDGYITDPVIDDSDYDGVIDGLEVFLGTDPTDSDSDNDGLSDGWEVNTYSSNPLISDTDSDGIDDFDEIFIYFTEISDNDTDTDGIQDGEEIISGTDGYITDPLDSDSDNDTIVDGEEIVSGSDGYITNPLSSDTDGDTLYDNEEIFGLNIMNYTSNPTIVDSDNDGVTDDDEISGSAYHPNWGTRITNPMDGDHDNDGLYDGNEIVKQSDPFDNDTDSDNIADGEEAVIGIDGYITSPINNDTDGDGVRDDIEIELNCDPNESDSDNDGLSDGAELYGWNPYGWTSDPTNNDTDGSTESFFYSGTHWYPTANVDGIDGDGDHVHIYIGGTQYQYGPYVLTDGQEVNGTVLNGYKSDPDDADTDNDGISDSWEIYGVPGTSSRSGSSPWLAKSKPMSTDSDSDGIGDAVEVADLISSQNFYCSDPLLINTDGDSLTDYQEKQGNVYNNWKSYPRKTDSDGDGVNDYNEIYGITRESTLLRANPLDTDTDDDTVTDNEEMNGHTYSGYTYYGNPQSTDGDGDGLSDYGEFHGNGLNCPTNPLKSNTDGDAFDDKMEIMCKDYLNPLVSNNNPTNINRNDLSTWVWSSGAYEGTPANVNTDDGNIAGSGGYIWGTIHVGAYWGTYSNLTIPKGTYRNKISDIRMNFQGKATKTGGTLSNLRYWVKVIKTDGSSYTTEVIVQSSPVSQTYYTKEESLGSTILDYVKAGGYIKEVGVLATGSGWNCIFAAYVDYIYITYKLSP